MKKAIGILMVIGFFVGMFCFMAIKHSLAGAILAYAITAGVVAYMFVAAFLIGDGD